MNSIIYNTRDFVGGNLDQISDVFRATYIKSDSNETFLFEVYSSGGMASHSSYVRNVLSYDKECLYLRAIRNLFRKLDFLELTQNLDMGDISEEEFDKELTENEDKYLIPCADEKPSFKQIAQVTDIVKRLHRTNRMSIDDVSELFSLAIPREVEILDQLPISHVCKEHAIVP